MSKKAVLIILDGYGLAAPTAGNAVAQAKKPNLDKLFSSNPYSTLSASGLDVGLPAGQMGNSEVGHTNMGAGRVVFQILPKMTQEIENGKFFQNAAYIKAFWKNLPFSISCVIFGRIWNTTRPAPMLVWPTSELPI